MGVGDTRPYTNEELATAHQAAKDFACDMGIASDLVTARDLAIFDYGFKRGRRTPLPATADLWRWIASWSTLAVFDEKTRAKFEAFLDEWSEKKGGSG